MPRPTATIRSACERSTACFASWNGASGFWRIVDGVDRDVDACATGAAAAPRFDRIGAERADLERHEMRRRPVGVDVGGAACPETSAA